VRSITIEQAFRLVRRAPVSVLAAYYIGSRLSSWPALFLGGHEQERLCAGKHLAGSALGVSLLFLWMKTWQAIYAPRASWTFRFPSANR